VPQEKFPDWLKEKATSLMAASGQAFDREEIIASFLHELVSMVDLYESAGFAVFRTLWETHAWQPEVPAKLMTPQGPIIGMPVSIDENGALLVQLEDGTITTVYSGEITDAIG
jgi:BirA family biotin operon repressor/biotin-[acetyl-CoA-carboxylase] ligase